MRNKHENCIKGFSWHSQSWYGPSQPLEDSIIDQLHIGFFHREGGTTGEFTIAWRNLGPYVTPQLMAFDDGWDALSQMPELIALMANVDNKHISIGRFVENLKILCFEDLTNRTQPNAAPSDGKSVDG